MATEHRLLVRHLGLQPYLPTWKAMQTFTNERTPETDDEIWLLQHPAVFTQGQAGRAEHLLNPGDTPVIKIDRGGQVTYHGPGQLVAYLLIDLRRKSLGPRQLVEIMEHALIDMLADYKIHASLQKGAPGVFVAAKKIASLGLRIRRGCSFHGLALNINMDLEPFNRINPCGYEGLTMTQVSAYIPDIDSRDIEQRLLQQLVRKLGYNETVEHFKNT